MPLRMPTQSEIIANYAELQKKMGKTRCGLLERHGDGPIEPLAEVQTQATLGWGRIGRRNDPEPYRCAVCDQLLWGTHAVIMGVHAHCADY